MSLKFILRKNSYSHALPILSLLEQLDKQRSLAEPTVARSGGGGGGEEEKVVEKVVLGAAEAEVKVVVGGGGGGCEGCRGVREREKEVEVREEELRERRRKLVAQEKRAEREFVACCKELNLKKEQLVQSRRAQGVELGLKLEEMKEKWKVLEAKEEEIKAGFEALESKERRVREGLSGNGCCCCNVGRKMEGEKIVGVKLQALLDVIESKENEGLGFGVDEQCRGFGVERDRMVELERKEKEINACWKLLEMREDRVNESAKGVELVQKGVDEALRVMKLKEEEMREGFRALEVKRKAIEEDRKRVELRERKVELTEKQVEELELQVRDIEECCKEMKRGQHQTVKLREKQLDEGFGIVEKKAKQIAGWRKEMEEKEKAISLRSQEIGAREKWVNKRCRASDLREQSLNEKCRALVSQQREFCEKRNVLDSKEKRLNERRAALALIEKQVDERCQVLKLQEQKVSAVYKAQVLIEKDLRENLKAVELKEKQLSERNLGVQIRETEDQILRLCKAMSGKALQIFLNERFMEHRSMMECLCNALMLSNDPAKLVLSAVYGFFPPHLERPGSAVDTRAVRTTCIVLLECLMNMRAVISEAVKSEAIKVANQWRDGISVEGVSNVVVLGFFLLLAAFNLGSNYEVRELQGLFEVIDQDRLEPQLGRRLGLKLKNDAQSDNSKDRRKRSGSSIHSPGQEKHPRVDTDHMFIPYHPADVMYGPPAHTMPYQCQYPVWPHGATPMQYSYLQFSQ